MAKHATVNRKGKSASSALLLSIGKQGSLSVGLCSCQGLCLFEEPMAACQVRAVMPDQEQ